jgi:hypothetical protein
MSDLTAEAAHAQAAAELPTWFYEQQIKSLTGLIDADIAQREALVRWIATIDENNAKWTAEREQFRIDLSYVQGAHNG